MKERDHKILILGLTFGILIILALYSFEEYKYKKLELKNKAVTDIFLFSLNVSVYCAESKNMTYQELLDQYFLNFTHAFINNNNQSDNNTLRFDDHVAFGIRDPNSERSYLNFTPNEYKVTFVITNATPEEVIKVSPKGKNWDHPYFLEVNTNYCKQVICECASWDCALYCYVCDEEKLDD